MTTIAERGMAPGKAPVSQGTRAPAESAAPAAPRKIKLPRDQDPRNPNARLAALLDAGSVEFRHVKYRLCGNRRQRHRPESQPGECAIQKCRDRFSLQ